MFKKTQKKGKMGIIIGAIIVVAVAGAALWGSQSEWFKGMLVNRTTIRLSSNPASSYDGYLNVKYGTSFQVLRTADPVNKTEGNWSWFRCNTAVKCIDNQTYLSCNPIISSGTSNYCAINYVWKTNDGQTHESNNIQVRILPLKNSITTKSP